MWPFNREKLSDKIELCDFESTKLCLACGHSVFKRRFEDSNVEIGLPMHIRAVCQTCGASVAEKLWCETEASHKKGQS